MRNHEQMKPEYHSNASNQDTMAIVTISNIASSRNGEVIGPRGSNTGKHKMAMKWLA